MRLKKYIVIILILLGISCLTFLLSLKKGEKLNVILIVIDALRADHLGCYGYARDTSPNIDKFAKEGVLFSNAFSHSSATWISVPSIFTSLYPGVHKVFKEGMPLAEGFITLPEILQRKGYITAAFVGPQLRSITNFVTRFQFYDIKLLETHTKDITDKVSGWLKQRHSQPFFLYLHYHQVSNYSPRSPYAQMFYTGEENIKFKEFLNNPPRRNIWKDFFLNLNRSEKDVFFDYILSQYDGNIRYADAQIKIILEELDRLGLSRNTLVILTADYGEELLDHGQFLHGNHSSVYDELNHIPLIMRLPKVLPQGKIVCNLVRHIDILPTILDVFNIFSSNITQGISLLPYLEKNINFQLDSFSEIINTKAVRTDKWKLIEFDNPDKNLTSYELHDLENDPKELHNLRGIKPKKAEQLKLKIADYVSESEKIRRSILGKNFIDKPITLDKDTKETLRRLGYIQ